MSKLDINNMNGAIFDVDGTLLDTMTVWFTVGARYLETLGVEADEDLGRTLFSMNMTQAAEYMIKTYDLFNVPQFRDRLVARAGENASQEQIADFFGDEMAETMRKYYFEEAEPRKGAVELIDRLEEAGVPMTIATSTNSEFIRAALNRLGMLDHFRLIVSGQDEQISKSTPEPFRRCLKAMGIDENDKEKLRGVWVFEDGLYAVKTAKSMGMSAVGIYDDVSKADQEEMEYTADIYVQELTELL